MNRRDFLKFVGATGLTVSVPELALAQHARPRQPVLRIAFLTDFHLPASGHNDMFAKVIDAVQEQFKVNLILFGGDNVFAADGQSRADAETQLENWVNLVDRYVGVPTASCLGNHDIWGWVPPLATDSLIGRRLAMTAFGMASRFDAFDQAGWRIIMLDAVQPNRSGYRGQIDKTQFDWLSAQLAAHKAPTLLVSHIPLLSVTPMLNREALVGLYGIKISSARAVSNARSLVDLISLHPNVKLCVSGHMHMLDHIRYKGVVYQCCGAVSGAWWKGPYEGFDPSFSIIDLFSDGDHRVVTKKITQL